MGLTITSLIVSFVAFALLLHLALFHVYINYVGITTYEYVRAHRLAMDQSLAEADQTKHMDQTTDSNCCQIFKKNAKIVPAVDTGNKAVASELSTDSRHAHENGLKRSTVEKLPPIHPPAPKEVQQPERPKGSSVPKLPKLVEENGSGPGTAPVSASTLSSRGPQLAQVHKHLQSVDFEDQDKIFVVEVS